MSHPYKLSVNENWSFNFSEEDLESLDAIADSEASYHLLNDHASLTAEVTDSEFLKKKYTVKINNSSYEVVISDALDQLIDQMGFAVGSSKDVGSVDAPMPGLILDISVSEGQEVKEGDPVLILEAMKMENIITSPRNGKVKSVSVKQGDAVEKKQLLIEFE